MGTSRNINEIKGTDRILSLSVIKSDKSGKLTKNGYDLQSSSIEKRLKKSSGWRTSSKINDLKNEMGISDLQAIQAFIFKRLSGTLMKITCWHTVCERQIHQIHFAAVLQQNMDWFDTHPSGELITEMFEYGTKLYNDGFIKPAVVFATFWATISGTLSLDIAAPQVGVVITAQTAASSIFEIINRSTIDGIPFDSMNIQWLRQMIGLVSQEPILLRQLLKRTYDSVILYQKKATKHISVKLMYGYLVEKTAYRYSSSSGKGSEDEAITALDTKSEKITTVERITFTMAHRLSTIRNMDHIIVLDHGKVIERGTNEELMARGNIYMKLVLAQNTENVANANVANSEEEEGIIKNVCEEMINSIQTKSQIHLPSSTHEANVVEAKESDLFNSLRFAYNRWPLLLSALFVTFLASYLISIAGESLTKRLRVAVFTNIVSRDGEYFDLHHHASGNLISRLAVDVPNIRAAIDQRFADVLQAITSILIDISVVFYYGPKMAPIGNLTVTILMLSQTIIAHYLKKWIEKDEALTREPFRRGIAEAFAFALHSSFIFFNFAAAYRYGL
ncbi:hypothetical protein DINM_004906 [Dirofilaria immitis]|nr:hypothetical protein [Dirofilaria immitis]